MMCQEHRQRSEFGKGGNRADFRGNSFDRRFRKRPPSESLELDVKRRSFHNTLLRTDGQCIQRNHDGSDNMYSIDRSFRKWRQNEQLGFRHQTQRSCDIAMARAGGQVTLQKFPRFSQSSSPEAHYNTRKDVGPRFPRNHVLDFATMSNGSERHTPR